MAGGGDACVWVCVCVYVRACVRVSVRVYVRTTFGTIVQWNQPIVHDYVPILSVQEKLQTSVDCNC